MPLLSAFTVCGQLRMSARLSDAENAYNALVAAYNGKGQTNFDVTSAGHMKATLYARARAIGRAKGAIERAGNQRNPLKAYDLLPSLEKDYGVLPSTNDTVPTRQANVGAKRLLPKGAVAWNIAAQLRAVLGGDFVGYFPANILGDTTVVPASPETSPQVNALGPSVVPKWLQLVDPVVQTTFPWTVAYKNLDTSFPLTPLLAGDVVMVQGENSSQGERVTVQSVGTQINLDDTVSNIFTAQFTMAHDIGATVTTMNWPAQWAAGRTGLIVVKAGSVYDIAKRRKVHAIMNQIDRGVSQWAIVYGYQNVFAPPNYYDVPGTAASASFILDATPLASYANLPVQY